MPKIDNIHPGEVLLEEFLIPMDISAYRLSKETSIPQTRISQIIKGKRRITADTALRISKFFGTSAKFWLGLQNDYDIEEELASKSKEFDSIKNFTLLLENHINKAETLGWDINVSLLTRVVSSVSAKITSKDDEYVAVSDKKEIEFIKKYFLQNKLGIKDDVVIDNAISKVSSDLKSIRHKPRALFYYGLITHLNKESVYK